MRVRLHSLVAATGPYRKALAPFAGSLALAGLQWAYTGTYDATEVKTNVMGAVAALLAFIFPNVPKPKA